MDEGGRLIEICVNSSTTGTPVPVELSYMTLPGSATESGIYTCLLHGSGNSHLFETQHSTADYTDTSGLLTFNETGQIECFDIPVIDNSILEDEEVFFVMLLQSPDEQIVLTDPRIVAVTVIDDDGQLL